MKTLYKIGFAALLALGLSASSEAREGRWSRPRLVFASEGNFSHDNSTTASIYIGSALRKNTLSDGDVIVMKLAADVTVNATPTLTISPHLGGTDFMTSAVSVTDGTLYIEIIGVVRSMSAAGAGTILWSMHIYNDAGTDVQSYVMDAGVDTFDNTLDPTNTNDDTRGQQLGVSFDWSAAHASNTLDVEQFTLWVY